MRHRPRTDAPREAASGRAPVAVRRLYQDISQDPRYGHYARIPERIYRCLEHFGAAGDRQAVVETLRSYYLFIGVADDALDSNEAEAGGEVLRLLRARTAIFDAATRRSRLRLATEVFKCHVAHDIYTPVLAKLERLYRAVVGERESATMAAYIERRRVVGRLTAEVSYLLYAALAIGLLISGALRQRDLERAMRTGGHVPLRFRTVGVFTGGGIALALMTVVLVLAQS
jgi:hypothetical protein